jgi:hypothetical protein
MQYLTGMLAFGVECERESCGRWNTPKKDFLNDELFILKESDESPFKDYGIEKDKLVPYREFCLYNVADHVRAYCDLLYAQDFKALDGAFAEYINNATCRKDIFMLVYGKLRKLAGWNAVNEFMMNEFGNAWVSYIDSVQSVAEHISNRQDAIEELEKLQNNTSKEYSISATISAHPKNTTRRQPCKTSIRLTEY